jgi:large subunit ribosomal protein L10
VRLNNACSGSILFFKREFRGVKLIKEEKKSKVKDIKGVFESGKAIIFTDHSGVNAESTYSIRNRLNDVEASLKIVKNTLSLLAAGEAYDDLNLEEIFKGPTSLIISEENVVKAAKLAKDFQREFESFKIKGGLIDGRLFSAEEVLRFAALPPREVLLAQLLGVMMNPLTGLVTVLSGVSRSLVVALDAIRKQKEGAA